MLDVCGVLQPDLIPEWLSKTGPAVAALVAVFIYAMNRLHARADLQRRRNALRAALSTHLIHAFHFSGPALDRLLARKMARLSDKDISMEMLALTLDGVPRMTELQGELFRTGALGDDVLAEYIEICRSYELAHHGWSKNCTQRTPEGLILAFVALEVSLRRMATAGDRMMNVISPKPNYLAALWATLRHPRSKSASVGQG